MSKYLFFNLYLSFLLLSLPANSQDISQKIIGTTSDDSGSLFKTRDGFHLIGYTNIYGNDDIYIVQLGPNLEIIWSKTFGAYSGERAMKLVQKPNGNLLISGWGSNNSSTLLLEINSSGDLVDVTGFGNLHDRLRYVIKTIDGGYLNYGELEGMVLGRNKVSLLKYDSKMEIEWKKFYNYSTSSDSDSQFEMYGRHIVQLNNSSFVILGSYTNTKNASNNRKIRMIKIDENGNEEWVKGFHGGRMDNAFHMILCNDGGYLISATSNSYSIGNDELLLIKTNENGEQEWLKTYGGNGNEIAGQVLQLPNGNFMISGSTNSFGLGNYDFLLFEIDAQGNTIKAHTYGGEGDDFSIKLDTIENHFILSGNSTSFGQGDKNIYIVKTKFKEVSNDCSHDVSSLLKSKTVSTTVFSGHYSQGDFVSPISQSLSSTFITSMELEPCFSCPSGEQKTITLCPNDSISIDYDDDNIISVKWQDGYSKLTRTIREKGTYWVDVAVDQCTFRDTIIIKKETISDLDLGENRMICFGDTMDLNATISNALRYEWHDGTTGQIYRAIGPGEYKVIVETNCGVISDSIKLLPPENEDLFIPNVITPNTDGYNDFFEILGTDFNVRIIVFNRWGKEVYKSNLYNNKWNGRNLSPGIYYYLVNIGCTNQDYKGWLQIIE